MRQVKSKSCSIITLLFLAAAVLPALVGCRDNPEDKAARGMHQQIRKALAQSDTTAAQQQVQSAISTHRPSGLAQESAYMVSGHLALNQGLSLQAELHVKTTPVRRAADAIAVQLIQSQRWLLEKERIDKMLTLHENEIVELKALIAGAAGRPGLQASLAEARGQRDELLGRKQAVQNELDAIRTVVDDYQMRSESLLKQADMAAGDEKLNLHQRAYALLLDRTDDHLKAQAAENQIALLDSQIALVQTRVDILEDNLRRTQAEIQTMESSPAREQLRHQQVEIDQLLSSGQQAMFAHADQIKADLDAYRQAAQEACDTLRRAAEHYQRVRSADAALAAGVRQGDSYAYAAIVCAEKMAFANDMAARLTAMIGAADETLARGLAERLPLGAQFDPARFSEITEFFDMADQAYDSAMAQARRLRQGGNETASSILKSRLLALYNKMRLADTMAQYDVATQTQLRLEELKTQGQEDFGELFTNSETARLLDRGLDYTPSLPINVELYFESIRAQFIEWRQLPTPEQQAAAVAKNLEQMQRLIRTHGQEMQRLLEPLKTEMEAARERGFETQGAAPQQQPEPQPDDVPGMDDGFGPPPGMF